MDKIRVFLSVILLFIFAFESNAQDFNYKNSIDNCYSTLEFQKPRKRNKLQHECYVDKQLPEFEMFTMEGKLINNENLAGKITVINFWFTACPPCIAEMPGLLQLSKEYSKEQVSFIAASTDNYETIKRFVDRRGSFGFVLVPDASSIFYDAFYIQSGFPTTIIIDKEGSIQYFYSGGLADFRASKKIRKKLRSAIDDLLEK